MRPDTLGIIGLGAIGGSVAWHAARAGVRRILGYSPVPKEGVEAVRAGAVTEVVTDPRRVAGTADLLVLAAPPRATLQVLQRVADLLRGRAVYCTDVSSVKQPIVDLARQLDLAAAFAGSHPLAGTAESGFGAARPDRFHDAVVYVTPVEGGDGAAREIADFWKRVVGAHPVIVTAAHHDAQLAWTSHLPQVIASGLAAALARSGPSGVRYGTGALSTTRLALSSLEMWTDVLLLNRHHVLVALDGFGETLAALRRDLEAGDGAAITQWLDEGRRWRRAVAP